MRVMTVCLLMIAGASFGAATYSAAEEFGMRSTWQPPTRPQVRAAIDNWIGSRKLNELEQLKLDALWPAESAVSASDDTLRDVAITISLLMPETQEIVDLCRGDRRSPVAPQFQILTGQATAPFVRHNLRLWLSARTGWELHPEFEERYGEIEVGKKRGGIILPGIQLTTPLEAE